MSISFDPETDTKEKIKEFGDRFYADYSGWYFLRGDQEETRKLMQDSFKIPPAITRRISRMAIPLHWLTGITIFGRLIMQRDPAQVKTEDIVKDIKSLIKE